MDYDPDDPPHRDIWLAADEATRLAAVEAHHRGGDLSDRRARLHAAIHVTVENQLAEGHSVAALTLDRLILEGASRHAALHAIGSVVAEELFEVMKHRRPHDPDEYARRLDALRARDWQTAPDSQ